MVTRPTTLSLTTLFAARLRSTVNLALDCSNRVYESALCMELHAARIATKRQIGIPLYYKGVLISEHRPDLIVGGRVIVEVKSIERFDRIHIAQLLTYLRITGLKLGLLLNFNSAFMRQGIRRVML